MGILVVAVGVAAGFAGLGFTYYRFGAIQLARIVLWIGALLPLAYTQAQTTQTLATGSISTLQSIRGLLPAFCILLARLLTKPTQRSLGRVEWFVVLYLSFALTSTAWSISPKQTLLKAIVLILGFLCLWDLVRRYNSPKLAIQGLASFTHCTLLIVALEVLILRGRAFSAGRLQSVFPQIGADVLGTLTVIGILALFLKQGPRILSRPAPRYLLAAIYLSELLATHTRSALIFATIVIVVGTILQARHSRKARVALPLLMLIVLGSVVLAGSALGTFLHRGEAVSTYSTLNGRTVQWSESESAWKTSPFVGLGYYSGHRFGLTLQPGQGENSNPDDTWLETLVDLGIVGLFLLAGFVVTATVRVVRARDLLDYRARAFVLSVGFLYLLTSLVNPTIESNNYNFIVWGFSLLAVPVALGRRGVQDQSATEGSIDLL